MLEELRQKPLSAWTRIELENVTRKYRTPRILDEHITLDDYEGPVRQISIEELGHEEPTLLITNQLKASARDLVGRYARRMLIENKIADSIDFFHMDALSSAVAMKVNLDVQLTLMGSSLYRARSPSSGCRRWAPRWQARRCWTRLDRGATTWCPTEETVTDAVLSAESTPLRAASSGLPLLRIVAAVALGAAALIVARRR